MNRVLRPAAVVLPIAVGYYVLRTQRSISSIKSSAVNVLDIAPQSFLNSKAHTIVNPGGYAGGSNGARTIVVRLPASKPSASDEQILADFVGGFFGGWVFAPERVVLQAVRRRLVNFSCE